MPKTKDGLYFVSATEQEGSLSGERCGRVWVQDVRVKGACSWSFYQMAKPALINAAKLEKASPNLTTEEFDSMLADLAVN